ncbi:MAG: hypothetical protein ACO3RV_08775, partial [Luteolibacter sp.]
MSTIMHGCGTAASLWRKHHWIERCGPRLSPIRSSAKASAKMLKFQPITRSVALAAWLMVGMSLESLSADESNLPSSGAGVRSAADGSIITRRDARTITQRIPAPRGLITARDGEPLAQNEVAYRVALQYRQFENADRNFVVDCARTRIESLQKQVDRVTAYSDDALYDHYRHRRWLPLPLSDPYNAEAAKKLEPNLPSGLELQPIY